MNLFKIKTLKSARHCNKSESDYYKNVAVVFRTNNYFPIKELGLRAEQKELDDRINKMEKIEERVVQILKCSCMVTK